VSAVAPTGTGGAAPCGHRVDGLEPLRKGYGYHVTVAVRKVGVLQNNQVSKAASLPYCPECEDRRSSIAWSGWRSR
jgi:hypothetical protein